MVLDDHPAWDNMAARMPEYHREDALLRMLALADRRVP
jgi:hypothetical protein